MTMWTYGLCVAAGVLHGFSMAWPAFAGGDGLEISGQASGLLQCISLAILGGQLLQLAGQEENFASSKPKPRMGLQAAWLSALFATSAMTATWGWLYVSMNRYGGLSPWLSALAVLLLASALSLYFALAGGLWVKLFRAWILANRLREGRYAGDRNGSSSGLSAMAFAELKQGLAGACLFAALWTLAELARGQWFTGFPWGAGGYAHTDSLLATYAPWLGVYGIGFLAALLGIGLPITLSMLMARRSRAWWGMSLMGLTLGLGIPLYLTHAGLDFTQTAGTMKARLLQGNIPQDEKFIPAQGVQVALNWYSEQLLANTESLVVTPETAIPVLPQQLPTSYWQALKDKYKPPHDSQTASPQMAWVGLPMGSAGMGYSNSVISLSSNPEAYRYDKQHLVPFGEFVPPFFQWFVRMMNIPLGDFAQNRPAATVLTWQGQRLLPQICYEDLFGEELARYFADEKEAPTVLVNMSNLAWFGDTTAPAQHSSISRMRALEFQRPVIRATNSGQTAFIDAKGVNRASLPAFTRGVLVGEFEGRTGLTPYAQWTSRWGLTPLWWLCGAIVLVLGAFSWRFGARAL